MTRGRLGLALTLAALALPAAAAGAGATFVVEPDAAATVPGLPSAAAPNAPGQIAVDADFSSPPDWVEQRPVDELRAIWEQAASAYSIRWEVLAAIIKVESIFGGNMGPSSAGAVGWMQFMPDTWLRWGVDANRDGVADPWNAEDAIFAAARYLAASGGATDIGRALYSYNHADWYVSEVLTLADAYAGGTIDTSGFGTSLQPTVDVSAIQARVTAAADALARAESVEQRLAPVVDRATARLARARLMSDALLAQKRLTIIGVRYDRALALTKRLRWDLTAAQAELEQAHAAAFATPTPLQLLAAFPFTPSDAFAMPVAGATSESAATALRFTLAQLGTPYRWGGEGPDGFDCSGLTQAAYQAAGISLPRVAQQQFDAGPFLPPGEPLQPGDLVFFGSDGAHVGHVGLVAGAGLMVDAPHTGSVVRFDSYQRSSYLGATRPAAWAASATPAAVAPDGGTVVDFATAGPESPTAGEILFTKNP